MEVPMERHEASARRRRALIGWVVVVLVVAVVATVGLTARRAVGNGRGHKKTEKVDPPAAPVELSEVRVGNIATYLQNTTTLEPRNTAVLVARRQGQVLAIPAEEGMWVNRGTVLARLDDREARLAVQRTELAAEVAKREVERGRQLHEQGYLSPKELDDLEVRLRNAWVGLEQARYDLSQMTITAPFAGRVVQRLVQLGETVTAGKECFRVDDFDPVLARLYFPERELSRVRVGLEAAVAMDAHPGERFRGRVSLVNPVVDRANGTFKVTVEVPNRSGLLRPGTFARVQLKTGEFSAALLLPRRALLGEDGEDYVFVARADTVVHVPVRVGAIEGDTAQILQGLKAGDRVVTVGQGGLKTGTKIKPVVL
jgi:membrane fusion protein (multidrug efflux system)